ncbi:uncharacterized protein LOC121856249 isoform X2 [Homarus americanus]|uniref:uncharacterized protein LOC121856249 isoform X2 n=1 Tax=Homarus americanus TaxID=6706 RepID=UPI001C43F434|nr:uncharacterized protein LOC121856249 isoform X2 [Homarus americanus]
MTSTLTTLLMVVMVVMVAAEEMPTEEEEDVAPYDTPVAEERVSHDHNNHNETLSPAEELLRAAEAAGYDLTLQRLDIAAAATDLEVEEMMPAPVAEAFIAHRRMDNFDRIREQMIGMIFTGKPQPLGFRPRRPAMSRSPPPPHNFRSNQPGRFHAQYNPQGEPSIHDIRKVPAPDKILKPLPFAPGPTMVKFPHPPPRHHPPTAPSRQSTGPVPDFSNTVGPDFGPVTINDFNGNFGFDNFKNNFGDFNSANSPPIRPPPPAHRPPPPAPHRPSPPRPAPRPSQARPAPRPEPTRHRPRPRPSHSRPGGFGNIGFGGFSGGDESCVKYTDDICLDTESYPHEAILSSLVRDPSRADNMMAEVRSQSADELIDGVTSSQEAKYNYQHYFGNRRADTVSHAHRDFAQDGGFLCPAEVKYARPKRARNSKGAWKFIVNMDKYSQTIRMEKCMKPGGACSYVSHHYRATCNQIYNYHRLLSWEEGRGLHMDIFKVPSCCSCHIQGYAYVFPPLNKHQNLAGSEQVIHTVPAPSSDPEEQEGRDTQGFTPVNRHPGGQRSPPRSQLPARSGPHPGHDLHRMQEVEQSHQQEPPQHPTQRLTPNPSRETARARNGDDRVNYGYHPIIDFFTPYRIQ